MKDFSTDGEWGTLLPYTRGLRLRIPSWIALIPAIPLLVFGVLGLIAHSLVVMLLFGVPGFLFFLLWVMTRHASKKSGTVRINRDTKMAIFTEGDGAETTIEFQRFRVIKVHRLIALNTYSWMAVLCGETSKLLLISGFSFQNSLIKRVSPVAKWLAIPVEVSTEDVNILEWLSTPNVRTNPYQSQQNASDKSSKRDALKRVP